MSLEAEINQDIKAAMLAKEREKLEALRAVKAAIIVEKSKDGSDSVAPEVEVKLIQKLIKQRKDAADIYNKQGRADLAKTEEFQLKVLEKYAPAQMEEAEVKTIITGIISDIGASGMGDMGKVIGAAMKQLAGKADGKMISSLVRELL